MGDQAKRCSWTARELWVDNNGRKIFGVLYRPDLDGPARFFRAALRGRHDAYCFFHPEGPVIPGSGDGS